MRALLRLLALCVALVGSATLSRAQTNAGAPPADPVARLVGAYRAGPVADRVGVSYTAPGAPEVRSMVTVRVEAESADAAHPRPARVRLTLGRLEVFASGDSLLAHLRGEPKTCFEAKLAGGLSSATLRGALPALPLPQLQWALGDDAGKSSVHPYGLATTADGADPDGSLRFRASDGVVLLKVDARGGRARSIVLNSNDSSVLRLEFTPIDAGDPSAWAIDIKGRTRVGSLAELQSRAPVSPVGVRVPELGLVDAELRNVSGAELRAQGPGAPGASSRTPTVLVLYAANAYGSPDQAHRPEVGAALEAAGRVREAGSVVAVGALPEGNLKPEKLIDSAGVVEALAGDGAKIRVLFSPSARGFMEKWEPGAGVLLLAVRADGVVGGLVACDGRDSEAIAAELRVGVGPTQK